MPEIQLQTSTEQSQLDSLPHEGGKETGVEGSQNIELISSGLDDVAESISEIAENREAVTAAAIELAEQFSVNAEFFEEKSRMIVFSALANELTKIDESAGFDREGVRKKEFIADATYLLVAKYTDEFDELKGANEKEANPSELSDNRMIEIYEKYTNQQQTAELQEAIDADGVLDGVKERLGITSGNEDPYKLRVMSFGTSSETHGLSAGRYDWENHDAKNPEDVAAYESHSQSVDDYRAWEKGLEQRRSEFAEEMGYEIGAPAWVTRIDGETYLCVSQATAEKILHPELTEDYYGEDEFRRDLAYLEHEYTHTQGGVILDHGLDFGLALEERRAEYFSGDKHGYRDTKHLAQELKIATDFDLLGFFDDQEAKGGKIEDVYEKLAEVLGVEGMLQILMALPSPYDQEQSNQVSANVQSYIGGISGAADSILQHSLDQGNESEISARADILAEVGVNVFYKKEISDIDAFFHGRRGGEKMAKILEDKAKKLAYKKKLKSVNFN